ncbi:F-box protein At4g22280-like [Malania oleifera]|uniref:F-box protein At4g22280-like n=1 Tax=Malania oleifera TaxID=397392 RepID=UPI0025ADF412|nr:F-box protein At4g22280-like [Malania oleifera]
MGESLQKRKKVLEDAEDRISSLPDSVLCCILSFLPTKDAGRTSILSTRWKYLFVSSPNLEFDDSFGSVESRPRFVNFVYRVLALRASSSMNRFRLKCEVNNDDPHVNRWISAALCRNVQELEIELCTFSYVFPRIQNSGLLPYDLFTCRTLVVLKLDADCSLNVPRNVSLPNLKTLHLQSVLVEWDSFKRILSGCPVLEDLLTCGCRFMYLQVFDLSVPTLKRLTLGSLCLPCGEFYGSEVVIDAPYLQCIRLKDNVVKKGYTLKGLTSPTEAHISIKLSVQEWRQRLSNCLPVAKLFEAISKVESLHLAGYSVLVLDVTQPRLPTFPNLTRLEVASNDTTLGLLAELLHCSPNLEVLVVGQVHKYGRGPRNFPIRTGYLSLHLKEVDLREFTGKEDELEVVEYLLDSAQVLEKMTIVMPSSMDKLHVSKKVSTFPRQSRACHILVT